MQAFLNLAWLAVVAALLVAPPAAAQQRAQYESLVATHARANNVPEALVHRVIVRESRYRPDLVGRGGTIGLMQIKLATARGLGYTGDAQGLRLLYQKIDLEQLGLGPDALPELLLAAERMGFAGLNATHPCKQAIIPQMSTGATDGLEYRARGMPVYGVDGSWGVSPDDERAHGKDERIPVQSLWDNILHWERMVKELAS